MAGEIAGRAAPAPVPADPAVAPPAAPPDQETPDAAGAPTEPAATSLRIHPADRRMVLALLAVIVVSLALRLVTWNGVADGDHSRYVKTTLFGGGAAAVVWLLIRVQTVPWSRLPLLCAALVLLSGDAIHYVRLANPITRGGPVVALNATIPDEATARRSFDFETAGGGSVRFESGAVRLESPPGGTAYMVGKLPAYPDVRVNWWLPVGLAERDRAERIAWRATINRTGGFYVVTEIHSLLVQVVGYGIHITYPDERKTLRGNEVQHPVGTDGKPHEWLLTRDNKQINLSLDGRQVWSAPSVEELNLVKLGETKVDSAHGGNMRVESVSYSSSLIR